MNSDKMELAVKPDPKRAFFKVVVLCAFWFTFSALTNNVGKAIYAKFQFPTTLTMVQFSSITLYMHLLLRVFKVYAAQPISTEQYIKFILPLSFGKILATLMSQVSIWKVPVSYAHTVKALAPIFAVALSRIVLGEKQTMKVYLSLLPILYGVFIATVNELEFNLLGMVAALSSSLVLVALSIYSKKMMMERRFDHLNLLYYTARLSTLLLLPYWLLTDMRSFLISEEEILPEGTSVFYLYFQLFLDGFSNFGQNIVAFSVLSLVTPLTYSICNTSKRVIVISSSMLTFRNPVTFNGVVGMFMAIGGIGLYNKAKYDQALERKRESILPVTRVRPDDSQPSKLDSPRRNSKGALFVA
eukprot:Colp12_sorted_trinity150504_noHs@25455